MFAHVEIVHDMGEGLIVPVSAVVRTGERDLVYRVVGEDRFVPAEVEVGEVPFEDGYHVLAGLEEGERIATSATFLLDSETRLRESGGMAGMPGMEGMDMEGMEGMEDDEDGP